MKVAPSRVTRLEHSDLATLRDSEFDAAIDMLRFPAEFFLDPPLSMVSPTELSFRAQKNTTQGEKEYLAVFAELAGDFLASIDARLELPKTNLPTISPGLGIAAAALLTREAMRIGSKDPINHLTHRVEKDLGIPVIVQAGRLHEESLFEGAEIESSRPRHTAFSTRTGEFNERPIIVTRAERSWDRMRFSVAHELGHLVLHGNRQRGAALADVEVEANAFACELIAPAAAVRPGLGASVTLQDLVELKRTWGLSISAFIKHLARSGVITSQREQALQKQLYSRVNPMTGSSWGRTEPGFDDYEPERPRLLNRWAERVFATTDVRVIAAQEQKWPRDVLAEFLIEQRPAQNRSNATGSDAPSSPSKATFNEDASVIDFEDARRKRRSG